MTVKELRERLTAYPDDRIVVTYGEEGDMLFEVNGLGYLGSKDGSYDKEMPFFTQDCTTTKINLNKIVYIE